MIPSPRFNPRFGILLVLLPLLQLTMPRSSWGIQLSWSNGTSSLNCAENTRAMLVVRADSAEGILPNSWRLLWTADSSGITFIPYGTLTACEVDTARVASFDPPSTPADSAAHLLTAHFCSAGSPSASAAYYLVDLVGGSKGKLRVVALDPTDPDSNSVIESNEVTYNGGVDADFPPALLRATTTHRTALLEVTAVGTGLAAVSSIKVAAPDDVWSVPLTITSREGSQLRAEAEVPAPLPGAILAADALSGATLTSLAADDFDLPVVTSTSADTILYRDPDPGVYPHDFAFYHSAVPNPSNPAFPWKNVFHLFYIRTVTATAADSIIAHAWCDTLGGPWTVDLHAFRPSGIGWDKMKVWAPSIQKVGNLYYMFYTGVDSLGNQSIGYATTSVLGTTNIPWTRNRTPVYTAFDTNWADQIGHETPGRTAFRDPFVMPDPDHEGRYLLFNVAEDKDLFPRYVVGVARNEAGTLSSWINIGKYPSTDWNHLGISRVESPLVVRDSLTGAWRMFVANANYDPQGFKSTYFLTEAPGDSVTNRDLTAWPGRDSLYYYTGNDVDVIGWQACEHLQIGPVHFFAAYVGPDGIGITRMHWDPVAQKFIFVYPTNVSVDDAREHAGTRFYLTEFRPRANIVRFALEDPSATAPKLVVYDVLGRRVRALGAERAVQGRCEFTWDCRKDDGERISTGMYFARVAGSNSATVVRVPIIR